MSKKCNTTFTSVGLPALPLSKLRFIAGCVASRIVSIRLRSSTSCVTLGNGWIRRWLAVWGLTCWAAARWPARSWWGSSRSCRSRSPQTSCRQLYWSAWSRRSPVTMQNVNVRLLIVLNYTVLLHHLWNLYKSQHLLNIMKYFLFQGWSFKVVPLSWLFTTSVRLLKKWQ